MRIIYEETQHFTKLWLWVIFFDFIVAGIIIYAASRNSHEAIWPAVVIVVVAFGGVTWIMLRSRLEIVINSMGLQYRYPIFAPKWKS